MLDRQKPLLGNANDIVRGFGASTAWVPDTPAESGCRDQTAGGRHEPAATLGCYEPVGLASCDVAVSAYQLK